MTLKLAVDRDGFAAPDGVIVGIATTLQELRSAGFAADPYAGDRVQDIDETDATKWDNACQPGWYLSGGVVVRSRPASTLDLLKADVHAMLDAGDAVRAEITRLGPGEPQEKVDQAHQWMWRARGGSYLTALNRDLTIAQRRAWAAANRLGPTDVLGASLSERVLNYFTHFSGETPTDWITFARPADAVRSTLAAAYVVAGVIADDVDLVDRAWVDDILAGTSE